MLVLVIFICLNFNFVLHVLQNFLTWGGEQSPLPKPHPLFCVSDHRGRQNGTWPQQLLSFFFPSTPLTRTLLVVKSILLIIITSVVAIVINIYDVTECSLTVQMAAAGPIAR